MSETTTQKGHPKGLWVLFGTEMWERFNYYGMRAVLVLFMTKALLFDKAFASNLYGSYTSLVYLTPLIGGYIALEIFQSFQNPNDQVAHLAHVGGAIVGIIIILIWRKSDRNNFW